MDINTALERMRELAARNRGQDGDADAMATVFEAIDGWLTVGGFLPDAWRNH